MVYYLYPTFKGTQNHVLEHSKLKEKSLYKNWRLTLKIMEKFDEPVNFGILFGVIIVFCVYEWIIGLGVI